MSRLVVVEKVYYQPEGEQPIPVDCRSERSMEVDGDEEQVYIRKSKVDLDWTRLDYGWIDPKQCSCLVIVNNQGNFKSLPTIPTTEEIELELKKVVSVGIETDGFIEEFALIHPSESIRFTPSDLSLICLRSLFEQIRISIHAFPGGATSANRKNLPSQGEYEEQDRGVPSSGIPDEAGIKFSR